MRRSYSRAACTPAGGTSLYPTPCRVTATVADTGPGISPEDLPHVFRRCYRADASRARQTSGTGLGPAAADSLVRAHGGHLIVESVLGHGSTFTVTLPVPRA